MTCVAIIAMQLMHYLLPVAPLSPLAGSLMFYIFRSQTTAYGFITDLLFGGAKYAATGRGYKLAPTSFTDLYQRFGRSHIYFGVVLFLYCSASLLAQRSWAIFFAMWAPWLVVASMLFGPFWFTPLSFRSSLVVVSNEELLPLTGPGVGSLI